MQDTTLLRKRYKAIPGKLLPSFNDLLALEHRALQAPSQEELSELNSPTDANSKEADTNESANEIPKSERTLWLKIATGDTDRAGDRLNLDGCQLENFLLNPQLLWMHGLSSQPVHTIGRILRIVKQNNALYALAEYAAAEMSPFADQVYQLDVSGFLPANSIGFHPIEWEENESGGIDFLKWELIECSKVELPMNPFAINDEFREPEKALLSATLVEAVEWLSAGVED